MLKLPSLASPFFVHRALACAPPPSASHQGRGEECEKKGTQSIFEGQVEGAEPIELGGI